MSDLFLIAHKVRNEPAFDVAIQMDCPECVLRGSNHFCDECDQKGYWWIIPTSGHRAYPFWHGELPALMEEHPEIGLEIWLGNLFPDAEYTRIGHLPPSLPDHYATRSAPTFDLSLALKSLTPTRTIRRR